MNGGVTSGPGSSSSSATYKDWKIQLVEQLVLDISNPVSRENALHELSQKTELFKDLAPLLWNSFGTIAALLQEIVSIYPVLSTPHLTLVQSNRVCNALTLLQCVAGHPDTRMRFLNAQILEFVFPLIKTRTESRPFYNLRTYSLGVVVSLVKIDDTEVINLLLSTEIISLCLGAMETGSIKYKTVTLLIVQKILSNDVGLNYIGTTAHRSFAVGRVLANMVSALANADLAEEASSQLLKRIIWCYLRLSDNSRACDALRTCLPDMLRDITFNSGLREDLATRRWLAHLLIKVQGPRVAFQAGGGYEQIMVN